MGIAACRPEENPMMEHEVVTPGERIILVAVYDNEAAARHVVEQLIDRGFPMDRLSILGRVNESGDDVLGIYHAGPGERMKVWAKQGAFWGALWGLLAGAAGMFILPPLGPVLAAGPIAEALVGALEGAAIGGAAMTGAAAVTQLATALHRVGIPEDRLEHLHQVIEEGHYIVLLHETAEQRDRWRPLLGWSATELMELPYTGIKDLVRR
jgi:uncharacterized membrane protein